MRPDAISAALFKVYSGHPLTPEDCKKLNADEAEEVARILIATSQELRGVKP